MSQTTNYQQGFYDGVDTVRKLIIDDQEEEKDLPKNKIGAILAAYHRLLLKRIADLLHEPPAI